MPHLVDGQVRMVEKNVRVAATTLQKIVFLFQGKKLYITCQKTTLANVLLCNCIRRMI